MDSKGTNTNQSGARLTSLPIPAGLARLEKPANYFRNRNMNIDSKALSSRFRMEGYTMDTFWLGCQRRSDQPVDLIDSRQIRPTEKRAALLYLIDLGQKLE